MPASCFSKAIYCDQRVGGEEPRCEEEEAWHPAAAEYCKSNFPLDCGAKRSATPLWIVAIAESRQQSVLCGLEPKGRRLCALPQHSR